MNKYQKVVLVISVAITVYLFLAAPKYYHRYSPQRGHIYQEKPFSGARLEINYPVLLPRIVSLFLISGTLIILFSNFRFRRIQHKVFVSMLLSLFLILVLSVAHFGSFGVMNYYLLGSVYVALVSAVVAFWIIYFFIRKN